MRGPAIETVPPSPPFPRRFYDSTTYYARRLLEGLDPPCDDQDIGIFQTVLHLHDRAGEVFSFQVFNAINPSDDLVRRLAYLWNCTWRHGVPDESTSGNQVIERLESSLLVDVDQMEAMLRNAQDTILIAKDLDSQEIVAAIWGMPVEVGRADKLPSTYDDLTDHRTFDHCDVHGRLRACVSVVVLEDYNGLRTEQGTSLGQEMVRQSLLSVIRHPYQYRVVAYSRPSSLKSFVELVLWLRQEYGYVVEYDDELDAWSCRQGDRLCKVEIAGRGIVVDGVLHRREEVVDVQVVPTFSGYIVKPYGRSIVMDELGVRLEDEGYLVKIRPYLMEEYDQMARFHGGRGGVIRDIFPNGKRDPISLDYNIVFEFPTLELLDIQLFAEAYFHFSESQREIFHMAVWEPAGLENTLRRVSRSKALVGKAFSLQKMEEFWLPWIAQHERGLADFFGAEEQAPEDG